MAILYCRKCEKEYQPKQTIVHRNNFYCPICKNQLNYFGREKSVISHKKRLDHYDEIMPNAREAKLTGHVVHYSNVHINTLILECRDALKHNPNNIEALLSLAKLYQSQKEVTKALENLSKILTIDPTHQLTRQLSAEIYLTEKNYPKAIEQLEAIKDIDPNDEQIHINLGIAHYQNKNLQKSLNSFITASEVCKNEASIEKIDAYIKKLTHAIQINPQ